MADIKTMRITREKLAKALGKDFQLIKLIENLAEDVSTTLPDQIDAVLLSTLFSLHGADGSKGASQHALMLAQEVSAAQTTATRALSLAATLRQEVELLREEVHELRARVASAAQRAQATADQALVLTIGA